MKRSFDIGAKYGVIFIVVLFSLSPVDAMACACCADWGERSEVTRKIDEHEFGEISDLKISRKANLFITAAFPEGFSGIQASDDTFREPFDVMLTREGRKWTLVFKNVKAERGALVLTLPEIATYFQIDIHDGKQGGGGGPLLYKEMRVEGNGWGNGIFEKGITSDTKFHLVLQGRGNRCLSVNDFKNWNLRISGSKASYSFYGAFAKPTKQKQK